MINSLRGLMSYPGNSLSFNFNLKLICNCLTNLSIKRIGKRSLNHPDDENSNYNV